MKKLLFAISFSAVSFFCGAQSWAEYMSRPDANLYKAQELFYSYWQGKDVTEKGKGYKPFKRWENFMAPRVYPSGNVALVNQTGKNFQDWLATYTPPNNNNGGGIAGKFNNNNMIASTTWTPMGPFGPLTGNAGGQLLKAGRICFITVNPTNTLNLYIGTPAGGLWRSTDGGSTWSTNTDNFTNCGFSDLCIVPTNTNVMYAATGDGDAGDTPSYGVLKSTDGGNTWAATGLTFPVANNYLIRRLVVNPTNSLVLMAATNGGLYRTTNGGTTWASVAAGQHYDIEFQPSNPNTVYATGTTTFKKSTDGGATWTTITNGIPSTGSDRMAIAVTPANANMVYVIAGDATNSGLLGFYKSTDAGTTFTNMNVSVNLLGWASAGNDTGGQSWYDLSIAADPNNANIVVTGGVNVWRTADGGTTWTLYGHWTGSGAPFTHADHHDLVFDSGSGLYDTNDGTVYKRNGASWQEISGTMNISEIYKIGTSALTANRWITGHQDNGTSLWTGVTYSAQLGGDGMDCFIDRTNNNNMFGEYYQGQFMRTTNGGVSWGSYVSGISGTAPWVTIWKQDPQTAGMIYAGRQNMFKSLLSTGTWTQMAAMPTSGTVNEFAVAPSNSLVIYVLKNAGIYKTINGGTSWTTITGTVPVGSGAPTFITICPTDPNKAWVTLSGYSAGNKVFQTTDGGTTWTNYSANLPNLPANCSVYQTGTSDRIYVGMDVGVYYRDNTQASWTLYNSGLPNIPVFDMEISPADPTKLVAATYGRGTWKVDVIANVTPVSAFSYSGNPCTNSPIVFNDISVNGPTSWTWSASPAVGVTINTPSSQNPTITFANAGTYTVTLNTSNGNGLGTPASQTINIIATPTVVVTNTVNNICSGTTVNITASGATTYSWSNGATTSVIAVSPTASTVYTVTGNNGVCSNVKTASVNVTISPTVSVNNGTVCSGNPAIITASGATTYSWSNGATTNSISVTPSATAVYTVIGSNGSCTNAITSTVSVNTTPTVAVTGSVQSICSGATVNISATGANTYSWSNGATTSLVAVSPSATIVYTVTGTSNGCTNVKTATINVTTSPTVSVNNGTICNGGSIILTASGATTYSWSNGPITSTVSVSPSVTTVYTVTGSNGTCSNVKTVTVNVGITPTIAVTNSVQNICSGTTVNITASGATTYSWSNGATTSVIAVSPTANVVYTVTGYNGACSNVKTATVNVTASPTVNVNSASICSGTNVLLTASGATSYSWSNGPVTSTVSVSPSVTTVYTVTGSNGTCSNVKTATVTVTSSPTLIIANNSQTICSGSSVNINASGAATYFWNNGATTSVITVSPLSTTVYTVTGMNGSCQDVKTATVVVNGVPTLSVTNGTICAGNNVLLTASGATTYSWNNGATTSTINVSPAITTVYTVTGNSNGCSSAMTTTVIVNPLPSINASASETMICRGDAVTLNASGASTYTWQPGNLSGSPVNDNPFVTTTYTVNGTDGNGCVGTQTLMIQVNICTGMMENGAEAVMFSVFPNPATDYVSLFYPSSNNTDLKVQVIDALGRLISERSHTFSKNTPSLQINVSDVAKGTYFLKLIPKSGDAKSIKLIKD